MILGVGIDLVELDRIEKSLKRQGAAFIERIGHEEDLAAQPAPKSIRRTEYWASRFAAKEAFAKALGTGIGEIVPFASVGVKRLPSGQPQLVFSKTLSANLRKRGVTRTHISITHTATTAVAVVVLEGKS